MPSSRVVELDVLRGFAILFMLVNHYSVYLLSPAELHSGVIGMLFFISSFAPVIFFFVTGFGFGLSYERDKHYAFSPVFYKAFILIVMDAFMRRSFDFFQAWDFLAFIGFSMLVLHVLRRQRHAIFIAFIMMILLFVCRYIVPYAFSINANSEGFMLLRYIFGVSGIKGISYWPLPWLIYPLLGFFLGALQHRYQLMAVEEGTSRQFILLHLVFALLVLLCSLVLRIKFDANYFRWGTMSANYFIFSIGLLSLLWVITSGIIAKKIWVSFLSISGVSSLAVVPIHYFILHQYAFWDSTKGYTLWFFPSLLVFILFVVISAKKIDYWVNHSLRNIKGSVLLGCVPLIIMAALIVNYTNGDFLITIVVVCAQLILCLLISKPYQRFFATSANA